MVGALGTAYFAWTAWAFETNAQEDQFQYLEEVEGERSLAFSRDQNERAIRHLGDPEKDQLYTRLHRIMGSKGSLPDVHTIGPHLYNFWKDEDHKLGTWRRTSLDEFSKTDPAWEVVLDLDALGKQENESWIWNGYAVVNEGPNHPKDRALLKLSRSGLDAFEVREFDLVTKKFIPSSENGFTLPHAKTVISYKTRDILYIGTDFGPGSLTNAGYYRISKEWTRGTPLSEAKVVAEGNPGDVSVWFRRHYQNNGQIYDIFTQMLTIHDFGFHLSKNNGPIIALNLPVDAKVGVFESELLVQLRSGAYGYPPGTLLATDVDAFLDQKPVWTALFFPTPGRFMQSYITTKNIVVVNVLDNVQSALEVWRFSGTRWQQAGMRGPMIAQISVSAVDRENSDNVWLKHSSFVEPPTLSLLDASQINQVETRVKQLPAFYDSSKVIVEQRIAISADGTKVPYFLVKTVSTPQPTLLFGFGGFGLSLVPYYLDTVGPSWLERGYHFVVANIRGGGELGPGWHKAAMKETRINAYNDFIAISEALIAYNVTTPQMLGVLGGSNGGLLVGNMLVRRPDLFGAFVCLLPLLDMKRYSHLPPGESWMAEFGDPDTEDWDRFLHKYSPYHNVDPRVKYPPIFLFANTRHSVTHPGHARKMTALLQSYGNAETWYFENLVGGHEVAAYNSQRAHVETMVCNFLERYLNGTVRNDTNCGSNNQSTIL